MSLFLLSISTLLTCTKLQLLCEDAFELGPQKSCLQIYTVSTDDLGCRLSVILILHVNDDADDRG